MHTFPLNESMEHIYAERWEDVGRMMLASAQKLTAGGADFVICPDNTAHQALDLVRSESPLPWLHIAEEVVTLAADRGFRRLGVLGTRWLMEGPVYSTILAEWEIDYVIPERAVRQRMNDLILSELVQGRFELSTRQYFLDVIHDLGRNGCDAVVLGCTEIPLLISELDSPLPALDSTRILARAALREATQDLRAQVNMGVPADEASVV
jgi:aspartate racemase